MFPAQQADCMDSWTEEHTGSPVVEEPLYKNYNERYVPRIIEKI